MVKPKWKHISEIHAESIDYMKKRKAGLVKSLATPWNSFNNAGIGGLEWQSVITVSARPGGGKTAIVNQLTRMAHDLNPDQDFSVLDFQFEMSSRTTGIREFSTVIKRSYKELLSIGTLVSQQDIDKLETYSTKSVNKEIYQIDTPMTVNQMEATIIEFIKSTNKPVIITIDHSVLIEKAASEKDTFETLYNLGKMLTKLKKVWDIIFIVLTQMNRSIEDQNRKVPGTTGNYPTSADVFGAKCRVLAQ